MFTVTVRWDSSAMNKYTNKVPSDRESYKTECFQWTEGTMPFN